MNLGKYKDEEIIFVTPNETKLQILNNNSNLFLNIKYMSLEEYKKNYFFNYNNMAIDYLMTKYQYNLDFAKIIMNNLYAIDLDKKYNSTKLVRLQEIKKDLIEHDYLIFNPLFRNYIKNKKVIVYNYPMLEKYEEEMFQDATIENLEVKDIKADVYHCLTLEDEVIFVIEKILDLIKQGIPLNNIIISNVSNEYLFTIYKLFSNYHIPITIDMNQSIYGTSIVQNYLKDKTLPGFVNPIVKKMISVVNSLVDLEDSPNYDKFLINELKNTKISSIKYKDSVRIVNDIPICDDNTYLFVLGFNQDVLPKIHKDEDYISDSIKNEVFLYNSSSKNEKERNKVLGIISNTKNIFLSYKDKSSFSEYLKSSMIDDLELNIIDYIPTVTNSNFYNKLKLGEDLDNYFKYKEKNESLIPLVSHYEIPYNSYDNKFSSISLSDLYGYMNSFLRVSYTSLNSYYLCKFQYFINYILKINPYESNFSTVIGNLFHYMFSVMDNPLFHFEREWNNFLEKEELSVKERYFLENLKEDLLSDIRIIKDQEILTNMKNKKQEEEFNVTFNKVIDTVLTGKIDKVIYDRVNSEDLIGIIDYKTGSITTNINNLKYGLSMQLPIYLYLIRKSNLFTNPKIVGIYLQKVLNSKYNFQSNKTKEEMQLDNLKLQGYSTSDIERLSYFDKTYENSELIKGMKLKKDGSFSNFAKVLDDKEFDFLLDYTETKINEAIDSILEGDFSINPKVIDNKNVSCCYCKFKDLCFRTNNDFVYLEKVEDLSFLGGENNGMDETTE